jgi:MerR family copper efflux transcriptional regulator
LSAVTHERGLLRIGKVAERTGLSLRTLRYYEEAGLVVPSGRTDGGFRLYSEEDVARLLAVKQMKPLGLTLGEMAELLALLEHTGAPAELTRGQLDEATARLAEYSGRTHERIRKLKRDLEHARELSSQLDARLDACTTATAGRP